MPQFFLLVGIEIKREFTKGELSQKKQAIMPVGAAIEGSCPKGVSFRHMLGLGFIAGIGFTMSIFISTLSFNSESSVNLAKLAVIIGSVLAGIAGMILLRCCPERISETPEISQMSELRS